MSTIHKASNMKTTIIQNCKRPPETPTSAKTACKPFRDISRKELQILKLIDDYNYYMNGVDQADRLREGEPGTWCIRQGG
jgi:hypothetical protein